MNQEKLKFVKNKTTFENDAYICWHYSEDISELINDIVYDVVDGYFTVLDDDLGQDILEDDGLETYCEYLKDTYPNAKKAYNALKEIITLLNKFQEDPKVEDVNAFLENLSNILTTIDCYEKYTYFDNMDVAYIDMKETLGITEEKTLKLFDKTHKVTLK